MRTSHNHKRQYFYEYIPLLDIDFDEKQSNSLSDFGAFHPNQLEADFCPLVFSERTERIRHEKAG